MLDFHYVKNPRFQFSKKLTTTVLLVFFFFLIKHRNLTNEEIVELRWDVNQFFSNVNATSNAKHLRCYSLWFASVIDSRKLSELKKNDRKGMNGDKERRNSTAISLHRLPWANYRFENFLVPLFKNVSPLFSRNSTSNPVFSDPILS